MLLLLLSMALTMAAAGATAASPAGRFVALQSFGTPRTGGYGLDAFAIDGHSYLALAEFFGNQSTIYRWNGTGFAPHQTIPSHAGHSFRHFTIGGQNFLALANYRTGFSPKDPQGWPRGPWFFPLKQTNSTIWKYNASTQQFDEFQSLATSFANAWSAFSIHGRSYIAVANADSLSAVDNQDKYTGETNSTIYQYDHSAAEFQVVQQISTRAALDIESFVIGNQTYLAVANTESKEAGFLVQSPVFRWSEQQQRFERIQLLNTTGATGVTFFSVPGPRGGDFLAVANRWGKTGHREHSVIYSWDQQQGQFVTFQVVPTKGAYDWEFFTIAAPQEPEQQPEQQHQQPEQQPEQQQRRRRQPQPQPQPQHFLAVANHWDDKAPDPKHPIVINSTVYRWDDHSRSFVTYQDIPTVGAEQIRYFVVSPPTHPAASVAAAAAGSNEASRARARHMLAVAQCVDDASGWNTTSQILEFTTQ
jgi:hypothetical protein